jgi:putative RecB family exonuclease
MPILQSAQEFSQELYISYSQVFTYMNCSLKYKFQYLENRPYERVSIAPIFGSAIHAAIERHYRGLKNNQIITLDELVEEFRIQLELDLKQQTAPVIYKKDLKDMEAAFAMGEGMLGLVHENTINADLVVADVEVPLTATLYRQDGQPTDYKLAGVIDVIFKDQQGNLIVVDNKTAARAMSQETADENHQMTSYAYLLAANKLVFPTATVTCRFDVFRKLKTPKIEHVYTSRTADDRKRFARIANGVLEAIDAGIFIPQSSWLCADCGYQDACSKW